LQIIREHYAASARGDIAGMMANVAPDVRWSGAWTTARSWPSSNSPTPPWSPGRCS